MVTNEPIIGRTRPTKAMEGSSTSNEFVPMPDIHTTLEDVYFLSVECNKLERKLALIACNNTHASLRRCRYDVLLCNIM